jgi:hypothetical protein
MHQRRGANCRFRTLRLFTGRQYSEDSPFQSPSGAHAGGKAAFHRGAKPWC